MRLNDPNAKKHYDENINQLLAKKYGMSIEQAIAANANVVNAAKDVGLDFNFDKLQPKIDIMIDRYPNIRAVLFP
ncbi:MAG: hypothetical protein PWP56_1116 [Acetobacterium sp.]|nr:hypothetical protein [Acetobacterium sp.]